LAAARIENQALESKLKEALAKRPAKVDTGDLTKAQEQIRALRKENDSLKAKGGVNKNDNDATALRRQLTEVLEKHKADQARAEKLADENTALQRELKRAGKPVGSTSKEQTIQMQLAAARIENQTLESKLKEALAKRPAKVDSGDLTKAQEQIRALRKENDSLKAKGVEKKNDNEVTTLRRQLAEVLEKHKAEQAQAEKLAEENTALQRELKQAGKPARDQGAVDLLRNENERLKAQLATLQSAAHAAATASQLTGKLDAANARITSLQSSATVATLEKGALENKVKALEAKASPPAGEADHTRVADLAKEIRDLTAQRDELTKELAAASQKKKKDRHHQDEGETNEVAVLRARLAVAEAKPAPYTAEELALLGQTPPQPGNGQHSIHELPPGAAELVASARDHFAHHEFEAAEADYQKILKQDPKNPLALANLAAIELQENKLTAAEQHITVALAANPDDAYNLFTLGSLRYEQGKYDAALDALSHAAQIDGNNPEVQNMLGVTLSHQGQRAQAEAALRKAIEINPLFARAHNNLAVVYLNQTPPMALLARWHYEKAVTAGEPRNPDLEKLLAEKGAPVDLK
jgi:Tfp pilus assembly protein PilF/ribosomal protein S20